MQVIDNLPEGETIVSMVFYSGRVVIATQKSLYELSLRAEGYTLEPIQLVTELTEEGE